MLLLTPKAERGVTRQRQWLTAASDQLAEALELGTTINRCLTPANQSSLCASGTLEADPTYNATAGLGIALIQAPGTNTATSDWTPTGDGLYVQLTGNTSGLRVQLRSLGGDTDATKRWCAPVPQGGTGKIPWTSFNTQCWNNTGSFFSPSTPIRWIEITDPSSNVATTPIDFCLVNILPYVDSTDAG